MPSVYRLSEEERRVRDERKRKARQEYNTRPEVIQYQKEWHKNYSKLDYAKESHNQAQERYRNTEKGMATTARYWKKKNSKSRGNDEYPNISV